MSDHLPKLPSTPANWLQVQVELGDTSPDALEQALLELGAVSIELSDAGNDPIWEPAPDTTPLWGNLRIAALFSANTSETSVRLAIAGSTPLDQKLPVRFSIIEDEDWVAKWTQSLQPTVFGDNLWICPPDTPCPVTGDISVTMAPGLAFGTGSHPTTALCLEWLASQRLEHKSILDFGWGSGILGIAGLALGAARGTAVDLDNQALTATRENAQHNHCANRLRVHQADLLDAADSFDLIVANILSGTLIELEPLLKSHSRRGTMIALSGILISQIAEVSDTYRYWVNFNPAKRQLGWAILTGYAV